MSRLAVSRARPQEAPQETVNGAESGRVFELWRYREVLFAFIVRHVKVRYKQAAIGIGWSVLQPLFASLLFALFLGRFAHIGSEGVPYFVFALAGMVLWTFFAASVSSSAESLIRDAAMVRKVYFPRTILPLSAVGAALVDVPAALLVLFGSVLITGGRPSIYWLLVPLPLLLVMLAATSIGMIAAALNVYYRDVRHALPFVLQVLLFASPVVYSLDVVPGRWRGLYEAFNPMAAAIEDMRRLVLHGTQPDWLSNLVALGWLAILVVAGVTVFKALEKDFADRL
ncbi:MAG TPA: ABC transporter permease [Candidatus Dormibacteraeota bacterium]|nr:ABC transporter permease [Candidatus Dormibacteraeota bacterium]